MVRSFYPTKTVRFSRPLVLPKGSLVTEDPEVIRYILRDNFTNWTKPSITEDVFLRFFKEWMGDGIFAIRHGGHSKSGVEDPDHPKWKFQRKIAAGIFTRGAFKTTMRDIFVRKGHVLEGVLESVCAGRPAGGPGAAMQSEGGGGMGKGMLGGGVIDMQQK